MPNLLFPLFVGFLGSAHCLGMCGPLVLACTLVQEDLGNRDGIVRTPSWRSGPAGQLWFHLGRLFTYGGMGALVAGLLQSATLSGVLWSHGDVATLLGGTLLLFLGLALLRAVPFPQFLSSTHGAPWQFLGRQMKTLMASGDPRHRILLGMMAGLAPCCLSWAMLVTAATTQHALQGLVIMLAFGAGTTPLLLVPGVSASLLPLKARRWGERLASVWVVAMGIALTFKGARALILHHVL
jgi:hypothetical protein